MHAVWAGLVLVMSASGATAATLQVDRRGATPGAYATLGEAALAVRAGDTISLVPGSGPYREMLDIKSMGTASAPIVVEGNGELITGFEPFVFTWNASQARWEYVLPAPIGNQANGTINRFRHLVTYLGNRLLEDRAGGGFTSDVATLSADGLALILGDAQPDAGWEIASRSIGVRVAGLNTDTTPVAWHHVYRNLRVSGARNDGFNIHGTGTELRFENIEAFHNFDEGFSAHDSIHCSIDGGVFWGNDNGLYNQSSSAISMRVNNVRAYANLGVGISMRQGSTEILNSQAWDNGVLNIALGGTVVSRSVSTYRNRWAQPLFVAYQEAQGQAIGQSYPYAYEAYWKGQDADSEHQAYNLTGTEPAVLPVSKLPPFALAYADWRYLYFAPGQIADPATSGPASDPDGDGRPNQEEYRTGTNPLVADRVPVIASVEVPDAKAGAAQDDAGTIVLRRSGDMSGALTLYFSMGGSATPDTDYVALGNSIQIPAGAPSAAVSVVPLQHGTPGGDRLAQLTLSEDGAYGIGPESGTVVIDPIELPVITLSVLDASASETDGEDAVFRIRRSGSTAAALTAGLNVAGTATADEDYAGFGNSIVFPPGVDFRDLRVVAVQDGITEVNETVTVSLLPQSEYTLANAFGSATIEGLPLPTVTLSATDTSASESRGNPGAFTLTRSSGDAAMTVYFTLGGTATPGADYASPGGSATIPAGASSVIVPIEPVDDGFAERSESVTMSLANADTYVRGTPRSGTVTIANATLPTITVTTTDSSASEAAGNSGAFSISRTGSRTSDLIVRYATSGSASPDTDYAALSGVAEIAAGAGSTTVTVTPSADALTEGDETVQIAVSADPTYVLGTAVVGTVTVKDVPPPTVSLVVNDGAASEAAGNTGLITVRRTGSSAQSLSLSLSITGSAERGTDYEDPGTSVLIPAGFNSVTITIQPLADLLTEGTESAVLDLAPAAEYVLGTVTAGTVNIADVIAPTVTVSVDDPDASESGNDSAIFRLTRSGITTSPVSVSFTLGGTAGPGDYATVGASVLIPAGAASAMVTIAPIADSLAESSESVLLSLKSSSGYLLGSPASGSVTIYDSAPPTVTLEVTDAAAGEAAGNVGEFLLSRSGPVDAALLVRLSIGGTATNGDDYERVAEALQIPAGAGSIGITISPRPDTVSEPTETATLALVADGAYLGGASTGGTVSIANATPTTVALTVNDNSASEGPGNSGLLTVSRTGVKTVPLIVRFTVGGTATSGLDYADLGQQVEIVAGSSSVTLPVSALGDTLVEGTETVVVTLSADSGYLLGSSFSGTVNIQDVPIPTVSLAVNDSAASEAAGNGGLVTISRSGKRTTALQVSFSLSGSATRGVDYDDPGTSAIIAVGAGSVTVALTPLPDTLVEGRETAVFGIVVGPDYQVGPGSSGTVNIADVVAR